VKIAHAVNIEDLVLARAAGVATLVVTVNSESRSCRERDLRNRFSFGSFRFRPAVVLEAIRHPGWLRSHFSNGGLPAMQNWVPCAPPGSGAKEVMQYFHALLPGTPRWDDIESLRRDRRQAGLR
jgi:isopentenyl diphosphate isomerase/L-lactate dehydrogenase-like FMN-dependent dehydrogenase